MDYRHKLESLSLVLERHLEDCTGLLNTCKFFRTRLNQGYFDIGHRKNFSLDRLENVAFDHPEFTPDTKHWYYEPSPAKGVARELCSTPSRIIRAKSSPYEGRLRVFSRAYFIVGIKFTTKAYTYAVDFNPFDPWDLINVKYTTRKVVTAIDRSYSEVEMVGWLNRGDYIPIQLTREQKNELSEHLCEITIVNERIFSYQVGVFSNAAVIVDCTGCGKEILENEMCCGSIGPSILGRQKPMSDFTKSLPVSDDEYLTTKAHKLKRSLGIIPSVYLQQIPWLYESNKELNAKIRKFVLDQKGPRMTLELTDFIKIEY